MAQLDSALPGRKSFRLNARAVGCRLVVAMWWGVAEVAMPYLVCKKIDGSAIERWEVKEQPLIFGRGEQSDVRLKDERASRQHFVISCKSGAYFVQDLKSTNGTWVNGARITDAELKPNDRIRAGQTVFVFELGQSQGLSTVIGELQKQGKGYETLLGEISQQAKS
jgi:predicted component of type VI protein secretion system